MTITPARVQVRVARLRMFGAAGSPVASLAGQAPTEGRRQAVNDRRSVHASGGSLVSEPQIASTHLFYGETSMKTTHHTSTAPVPGPARGALLTKEYVRAVGRMADIWGWPLADSGQRKVAFCQPTAAMDRQTGDVFQEDRREVADSNQGLEDGFDVSPLDTEQVAAEVQDFGDHFWVFPFYDRRLSLGRPANASGRPHGPL